MSAHRTVKSQTKSEQSTTKKSDHWMQLCNPKSDDFGLVFFKNQSIPD